MEAIKLKAVIEKDGEINIKSNLSSESLLKSGIIGIWEDRKDIQSSEEYARKLRNSAQNRGIIYGALKT